MDNTVKEYQDRFDKRSCEMENLFVSLYGRNEEAWTAFSQMLFSCWKERPDDLRRLDRTRLDTPGWYSDTDMLEMLMYADAFAGTLSGVREKLDYIAECGVNYLHLMPILDTPEGRSDGGYAVSDFSKVRPDLGGMDDLNGLASECHKRGIAV